MAKILEDYLPRAELAKQLDKTVRCLERWEAKGEGPPVTRIQRDAYYYIPSLKAWLASLEKAMPREAQRRRRHPAQSAPAA